MENGSLSDRREFMKKSIAGAGLMFVAPAVLSSLSSSELRAQASGSTGGGPPPCGQAGGSYGNSPAP